MIILSVKNYLFSKKNEIMFVLYKQYKMFTEHPSVYSCPETIQSDPVSLHFFCGKTSLKIYLRGICRLDSWTTRCYKF
jgi:hypothetical protein